MKVKLEAFGVPLEAEGNRIECERLASIWYALAYASLQHCEDGDLDELDLEHMKAFGEDDDLPI